MLSIFPENLAELPEVPVSADSLKTWSFIVSQLETCLSSHLSCKTGIESPPSSMPSRLLSIEQRNSHTILRLIDVGQGFDKKYAALSYSWGNTQDPPPLTTARSSMEEMRDGIDHARIPSTLQDAVTVCLRLSIQFIWIDSLCIIQDDTGDWEIEASKMGDVYRNAFVTIISASTMSCHESFLGQKRDGSVALARVESQPNTFIRVRRIINRGYHLRCHEVWTESPIDPIDRRAWTLQERIMSSRSIIFTGAEVQWECHTTKACECQQETEESICEMVREGLSAPDPRITAARIWEQLIIEYTRRRLTVPQDKLPALSAIAKRLSGPLGSGYFAGIWMESFVNGLCWSTSHSFEGTPSEDEAYFPSKYVAPSVSWASVIGQIKYTNERRGAGELRWTASLQSYGIVHGSKDLFGRTAEAYIDMKAPIFNAVIIPKETRAGFSVHIPSFSTNNTSLILSTLDGPIHRVALPAIFGYTVRRYIGPIDDYEVENPAGFLNVAVYFIVIFERDSGPRWNNTTLWGLLLGQLPSRNMYERLGSVSVRLQSSTFDLKILDQHQKAIRIV